EGGRERALDPAVVDPDRLVGHLAVGEEGHRRLRPTGRLQPDVGHHHHRPVGLAGAVVEYPSGELTPSRPDAIRTAVASRGGSRTPPRSRFVVTPPPPADTLGLHVRRDPPPGSRRGR